MDRLEIVNSIADEAIPVFENITGLKLERPKFILKNRRSGYCRWTQGIIIIAVWVFTQNYCYSGGKRVKMAGKDKHKLLLTQQILHELIHYYGKHKHDNDFRTLEIKICKRFGIEIEYQKNSYLLKSLKEV